MNALIRQLETAYQNLKGHRWIHGFDRREQLLRRDLLDAQRRLRLSRPIERVGFYATYLLDAR